MEFSILGAGCGGQTFAGHLASQGHRVNLYNRSKERLGNLTKNPKITLEGVINSEGKLNVVTTNIEEALFDTKIILVTTTALGHKDIAKSITPYLQDGQIIILNPGRTFGSLEVAKEIYSKRPDLEIVICEANTLLYATRVLKPGLAKVFGVKEEVTLAAIQPQKTKIVLEKIKPIFSQLKPAQNILETSLGNIGAVFHPTIMLLNYQRILEQESFQFYCDGATKEVVNFMEEIDKERQAIADELNTYVPTLKKWLLSRYNLKGNNLQQLLKENVSYQGIYAPKTFNHRYILEDIPTGLIPLSLVGEALGLEVNHMNYLISQAEKITQSNLYHNSRTLESLGLTKKNIREELQEFITPKVRVEREVI